MATGDQRTVQPHDVEELLQTSETVLLAVDQVPFEVESRGVKNTFCLLVPLMTESGVELEREQFRNRERVWWMLRSDIAPAEIRVGMIWSAPIERSREYGTAEPEKDHYQARRSEIRPGARQYVEILNLKVADPDLAEVLDPEGVPWPYPPLGRVVLRGGRTVVGPFRTQYDFHRGRVRFAALTPGNPLVYRLSRGDFESETSIREFGFTANRWDAKAQQTRVEIHLIHERDLTVLQRDGEREDGATDEQVVEWALDLMEIPKKERTAFNEVFDKAGLLRSKASGIEAQRFPGRLERFLKLAENRQRIIELGSKVAAAVASREGFRELVARHIDAITAQRVEEEVATRRAEIERQTFEAERRLKDLQDRIATKEDEYRQLRDDWEREFDAENRERVRRIEERERGLERQEKEMVERLTGLARTLKGDTSAFGDQLLAQVALLQRLGVLGAGAAAGSGSAVAAGGARRAPLELPGFLAEKRARGAIDEEGFLQQFETVVAARGFVFDREDLLNFHVLVKTGMWTVLTGPSGRGKSSLPRLYAEALGCAEEFLMVPVRPDWLDDRDVVGAFNALSGRYEPAASGLVDRLIAAAEDERTGRGGIYIVCLDEMNLARVEHYFAQFLSVLEQPPKERKLQLYAQGLGDSADPYAPYRLLELGSNLRFVGTVNIDDTTHFFSPKVVDRAPIATFDRPDLRLGLDHESLPPLPKSVQPVHYLDYAAWIRPPDTRKESIELLLKIDEALRRAKSGLGFRLRDRILRYVASASPLLGDDKAMDFALVSNLVPRLRPTATNYADLLRELEGILPPGRFHRTASMLKALEEDPESDFFQLL